MLDVKRRHVLGTLLAGGFAPAALAQKRPARIGVLATGSAPLPITEALPRELAALGYRIGTDLTFDIRYADRRLDRANAAAADLVREKVDVIVTHFTPATQAARRATSTIPIVFAPAGAPVEAGLVQSLARPGGNVTGMTNLGSEIGGRRIQVLRDLLPSLQVVGVLASSEDPFAKALADNLREAAAPPHIRIETFFYASEADIDDRLAAIAKAPLQALVVQGTTGARREKVLRFAADHRLPVMAFESDYVRHGALVCVVGNEAEIYRRAASFVDRILKGAKPADLPVEQPTSTELIINRTVARKLGLTIPLAVQAATDETVD
jgi:putative ABC transport system substrate-binding protein